MRTTLILTMLFFATMSAGQGKPDEAAIRNILEEEVAAWNKGTPKPTRSISLRMAHSRIFWGCCSPGTRRFLTGQEIFKGMFRGTVLRQDVVSLRFRPPRGRRCGNTYLDFGVFSIGSATRRAPRCQGTPAHSLLRVMVQEAGDWKITVYHNVDVKPGVTAPEAQ